jgi:hypothetical protein
MRTNQVTNKNTNTENIDVIATKIDYIQRDVADIKAKLEADYVTQDEFEPIKKIVYGMVGVVLLAVIGALIALVVRQV